MGVKLDCSERRKEERTRSFLRNGGEATSLCRVWKRQRGIFFFFFLFFSFLFSFRFIHFAIICDRARKSGIKLDWKARRKEERTRSFRVIAVKQLPDVEFGKGSVVFIFIFSDS